MNVALNNDEARQAVGLAGSLELSARYLYNCIELFV
jgi:hypothetical protein